MPNRSHSFYSYLSLISRSTTPLHLHQILSHSIISGHHPNLLLSTHLISHLSSFSSSHHSLSLLLFSSIPNPDLFLFNTLLRSTPSPSLSLSLFSSLPHLHLHPNPFTFSFAISSSSSFPSPFPGRSLHARSILSGFSSDPFIGSALTNFYLNFADLTSAHKVFDRIPQPDTVSWNSLLSGLIKNNAFSQSLDVFNRMFSSGTSFDPTTFAVILPAIAESQDLNLGLEVHCLAVKSGMALHSHVVTGLISMYSKCGEVSMARFLFNDIERPDLVARNAMISGYSMNQEVGLSVSLFRDLMAIGGKPSSSTLVGMIPVFSPFGHGFLSRCIHGFVIKCGFDSNSPVSTAIMTVYSRLNDLDSAQKVFDEMPEKSLASWNAMISAYAQNGLTEMAISLFQDMQALNVRPNPVTVTSILSACAQLGALSIGTWVHRIITEEDLEFNVFVSTALIDMYAKCGSIKEAQKVFDSTKDKNVVSWNAMISGYGLHGDGHQALKLYSEMLTAHIAPTSVTFLSVLYACSHGGLVEEGEAVFESMASEHGVNPGPEHYACMVDLLGRAGKLKQALEFIETVAVDAGAGVWAALLGACMKHKETSVAQIASNKLFELEPENSGYYVLMSNIYSANREFPQAAMVRETAKSRNLAKTPGCTLIEIGEKQHVFTSGDRCHPANRSNIHEA
ncbi:TPR-like protein [Dioscorea alata]|uniref:TPR-like protein n=1 Tax=Dioscorea alata TaxID=55571 RepID=A0ACB7WJ47_DIOAL|nr:TPR-like protein [Dioscorea alata]